MSILYKDKMIAIGAEELQALRQELINEFQNKKITYRGVAGVLLTTAINDIDDRIGDVAELLARI